MTTQSNVCVCGTCVGTQCTCGCQNPAGPAASCQCGEVCNCGPGRATLQVASTRTRERRRAVMHQRQQRILAVVGRSAGAGARAWCWQDPVSGS